jgi:hypothetical protein
MAICFASGATLWFVRDMKKGFKRQFDVLHRAEELLGLYTKGVI